MFSHVWVDKSTGEMGYQGDLAYAFLGTRATALLESLKPEARIAALARPGIVGHIQSTPTRKER